MITWLASEPHRLHTSPVPCSDSEHGPNHARRLRCQVTPLLDFNTFETRFVVVGEFEGGRVVLLCTEYLAPRGCGSLPQSSLTPAELCDRAASLPQSETMAAAWRPKHGLSNKTWSFEPGRGDADVAGRRWRHATSRLVT